MREASIKIRSPVLGEISLGSSLERRMQTLAMFSCSLYFILPSIVAVWAFIAWCLFVQSNLILTSVIAAYLGYAFLLDKTMTTGTRPPFLRRCTSWWRHSCDYLPLLLVKTADLPSDGKYILGYHPHGIISVGCFGAFATDGAQTLDLTNEKDTKNPTDGSEGSFTRRGFSFLFPGLDRRVITLSQNFSTPFLREYFLFMGAVDSSKDTFRTILKRPSTAVVVVVGGAAESMETNEGSFDLVLEKRRGFVREAIMAQASLVPVLAFGENDLYHVTAQSSHWVQSVQNFVKKSTGFGMPVFQGRSIFFKEIGMMPQRKPVVVVVGAPIATPKLKEAFSPLIDRKTDKALNRDGEILKEYHAKYIQAVQELYQSTRMLLGMRQDETVESPSRLSNRLVDTVEGC